MHVSTSSVQLACTQPDLRQPALLRVTQTVKSSLMKTMKLSYCN